MDHIKSSLETSRQNGKHQVNEQRTAILDAAEIVFLRKGLVKTLVSDIADQAGITRMSLYRYFRNRDVIAVEIQERMINRIIAHIVPEKRIPLESAKTLARSMIRNIDSQRDAYRYMGMFESMYLDNPPGTPLSEWTKNKLLTALWNGASLEDLAHDSQQGNRLIMVLSTVIWFLEKVALRGELTCSDQSVPLEEHLKLFEEMIVGYIDRVENLDNSRTAY